jgi:hypothetical protein
MIINPYLFGGGYDPDAQAFITAAAITDVTQQGAINTLVLDLKAYSIWTKFKAIYPIVGGTASQHKYNLKDPRDLDAAFRLNFTNPWTHSATGMTPSNAFANTFLNPNTTLALNSAHLSYYSRTNVSGQLQTEAGVIQASGQNYVIFNYNTQRFVAMNNSGFLVPLLANTTGLLIENRRNATQIQSYKSGSLVNTAAVSSVQLANINIYLGAANNAGVTLSPSTKQCAFASIGDGLTDTDAANFYTAVQAYQTTLGRSIGTQTVSDPDAQAFINAAAIDDQVQANAINNLVIGMKADGLWTKMKAIYPIVGGTASSHAVNLKTPGTFNLTYGTGVNHSATGMVGNGTTGYANTNLQPSTNLLQNSTHYSFYSRTNLNLSQVEMGAGVFLNILQIRTAGITYHRVNGSALAQHADANSLGFYTGNRTASSVINAWKNGVKTATGPNTLSGPPTANVIFILGLNNSGVLNSPSTKECAFASIGDGLTDTDAANYYNRVQTFNTTLSRQV